VAFKTSDGLKDSHLQVLRNIGIRGGAIFPNLGMVGVHATAGQVKTLAANSSVRSVWSNDKLEYFIDQARNARGC